MPTMFARENVGGRRPLTLPEDRALVQAVVDRRDQHAFEVLYDRHTPALYGLALKLAAGDRAAADEFIQDAWIRASDRFARFEWRSELRTWLSGFVVNCAREVVRPQVHIVDLADDDLELGSEDPGIAGTFDRLDLERGLAALPPGYREVLVLHDIEGYAHDEIAALLHVATGTSKSQLTRARRALKRLLNGEGG